MKFIVSGLALATFLFSCDTADQKLVTASESTLVQTVASDTPDVQVALQFMNAYVQHIREGAGDDQNRWIVGHPLLTVRCREAWLKMMDKAYKDDPEMGLGFDPFLNAQDYPEKGFEWKGGRDSSGWFRLSGVDWPDFTVPVRVVLEDDAWKVDAAGAVNP